MSNKESACNSGDTGDTSLIPGSGRSPGEGNGNPLQYSCLEKSMDRGAWWATVHEVAKSWTVSYFCILFFIKQCQYMTRDKEAFLCYETNNL